jgi:cysteine desulfurase
LRAIGTEEDLAHSSIRFGIGRFTTEAEIDFVINEVSTAQQLSFFRARYKHFFFWLSQVVEHTNRLREMSPLWEMKQEGIDIKSIQWTQH